MPGIQLTVETKAKNTLFRINGHVPRTCSRVVVVCSTPLCPSPQLGNNTEHATGYSDSDRLQPRIREPTLSRAVVEATIPIMSTRANDLGDEKSRIAPLSFSLGPGDLHRVIDDRVQRSTRSTCSHLHFGVIYARLSDKRLQDSEDIVKPPATT